MPIYESKLDFIRSFTPEPIPVFIGSESMLLYITWNLYDRIVRGLRSFVILCDSQCYYDAVLVAGNVLEACAILSYIKDNETEQQKIVNQEKYFARCTAGRLISILSTSNSLKPQHSWAAYTAVLKLFYPVGHRIIIKPKGITAKTQHENIIKQINYRLGENQEKIRLITNNYNRPDPEGYIKSFSKRIKKMDDGFFENSYKKYCDFKHLNFVSPGTLTENIDEFTIDWFADLMTLIVGYLQKYKLNACII